jgi:LPS sulfotransferase NodH
VPQPTSSVVLCALPRTGSWLLAHLLHSSRAVGYPGEWFWRDDRERNSREWGVNAEWAARYRELAGL